ncbi:MAG: NAD(P)-dependent oxidoreductase [Acidobacteria bacterium]|nr:NAD(P)-dependent oxidoreductase [Acidobacteriota bacterium]
MEQGQAAIANVGFIGLGIMGGPMARNLIKAGFSLVVHSRTRASAEALAPLGATLAGSPAEVARRADMVVTMVPDSPDVELVADGPDGIFTGARPGLIVADMSTISPAVTRDLAGRAAAAGCHWLDAPVSGGELGAINGTLTIMIGGESSAVERARPVFRAMGSRVTHIGPSGHGQTAKLCNQILAAVNLLAACEALVLGAKAGLDLEKLHEALTGGAANSWAFQHLGAKILARDFAPAFKVRLQQKDLRLVSETARELNVPTFAAELVQQLLRALEVRGESEQGTQSLVTLLEQLAGTSVAAGRRSADA